MLCYCSTQLEEITKFCLKISEEFAVMVSVCSAITELLPTLCRILRVSVALLLEVSDLSSFHHHRPLYKLCECFQEKAAGFLSVKSPHNREREGQAGN